MTLHKCTEFFSFSLLIVLFRLKLYQIAVGIIYIHNVHIVPLLHVTILQLSNLNTPIHKWNIPGLPDGVDVFIKRDDLTGTELSGNKVTQEHRHSCRNIPSWNYKNLVLWYYKFRHIVFFSPAYTIYTSLFDAKQNIKSLHNIYHIHI